MLLSKRLLSGFLALLTLVLITAATILGTAWGIYRLDHHATIEMQELPGLEQPSEPQLTSSRFESYYPNLATWLPAWARVADQKELTSPSPAADAFASKEHVLVDHEELVALLSEGHYQPSSTSRTQLDPSEKVPRIIHQTWKTETLPDQWQQARRECAAMHPDYDYVLWTDADSRRFLVKQYPWFVETFDNYPHGIQRADAIRYFVLYHFGGIYMDLDIGCVRPMDPLLRFEVVLPETIPVGISNDLMFAAPRHAFFERVIRQLPSFAHSYGLHYPTVMFSTGPMFLSTIYSRWTSARGVALASTPEWPQRGQHGVRILPKSLYGKNLDPEHATHAFFKHFYGSSWHANDAGTIIVLRDVWPLLFGLGVVVLLAGLARKLGLTPLEAVRRITPQPQPQSQSQPKERRHRTSDAELVRVDVFH